MKHGLRAVSLAAIWIGVSEFLRNQLLFFSIWKDYYTNLGLTFPSKPINGVVWLLWSSIFAWLIYKLLQNFSPKEAFYIAWLFGFLLMWLTIGNLNVLPKSILWFAIPLSMLEVLIAIKIITSTTKK